LLVKQETEMALQTGQTANTIREASMTDAIEDFDPVIKRAADYAARLQKISDRLLGPQPTGAAQGGDAPIPHSLIHSLNQRRSSLVECLDDMERSLNTIERTL
jgi:hypothetical protein